VLNEVSVVSDSYIHSTHTTQVTMIKPHCQMKNTCTQFIMVKWILRNPFANIHSTYKNLVSINGMLLSLLHADKIQKHLFSSI